MINRKDMIGMQLSVYANQGMREAWVVAAVDNRALVEYVMPEGRCFLRQLPIDEHGHIDGDDAGRSISYNAIPKKYIDNMRQNFSLALQNFQGGFDAAYDPGNKRWARSYADREKARALAVRCRILDLPIPKEVA